MTQEEFYQDLLGFSDLKINSIEKTVSKIIFHCELKTQVATCPNCMEATAKVNQTESRKVQDLKISEREVSLASYKSSPVFLSNVQSLFFR